MRIRFRAALAALISCAVLSEVSPVSIAGSPAEARTVTPRTTTIAFASPPQRIAVKEPVRVKPVLPAASTMRPHVVAGVRASGIRGIGPTMLRPREIDSVLAAARKATAVFDASRRSAIRPAPAAPGVPVANPVPAATVPRRGPIGRRVQSLPSDPNAFGTGITPWWRYQEQSAPGGGHVMVNVGTGNLLLQDDDMSVPHKGVALAFQRTYNSQSGHDVNATDAAGLVYEPAGMYGNGWTNTFDAHIARNAALTVYTIFDIDGARYDYDATWPTGNPNGIFTPRAGNHAALAYDGACGYLWTKKSGTTYYFYAPGPHAPCSQTGGSTEGYTGRLYQIVGRNRNTYLTFTYSWDGGVSSLTGKISQISAQTESGQTATLAFSDVNGHRLLSQITYPDGATAVYYGYDGQGNLTSVSTPQNNSSGIRPITSYGYQGVGSGSAMLYVASPRWNAGCSVSCGSDGGILDFAFAGSSNASSTLTSIWHEAVVNPTIADGTNAPLQSGYSTTASWYLGEYYTTGVTTPTFRDTDGHMTNWVVDGTGRPTQTQVCTSSLNQGQQCLDLSHWLTTYESWDASNNRVSATDPRLGETDFSYDASGNMTEVGGPQTATSQGTFKPTKMFDYDSYNNIVGYCDEAETHAAGYDWNGGGTQSDSPCGSRVSAPHWQATYSYPSYEPYGELGTVSTPLGYKRTFSYAASQEGGTDFGLPTSIAGDPFTQADGTQSAPTQTVWYDGSGAIRCYSNGNGTYVASYDALGRETSVADPDDTSANPGSVCGKTTGQAGWNTQTTYAYFSDGSLQSVQTPAERTVGLSTTYAYDSDGNELSRTTHHGCVANQTCTAGTTQMWYDGADRLVETKYPLDSNSAGDFPWMMRYLYDLSQAAGDSTLSGTHVTAYGNLFEIQKSTPTAWTDVSFGNFDAVDRITTRYGFAPCPAGSSAGAVYCSNAPFTTTYSWDTGPQTQGLLASVTDGLGESKTYAYDAQGHTTAVQYAGDGGVTPARQFAFDAMGRIAAATANGFGTQSYTYTLDDLLRTVQEPSYLGSGTRTYTYNLDATLKQVDVADPLFAQSAQYQYAYRADGLPSYEAFGLDPDSAVQYSYTDGGRTSSVADVVSSASRTAQYGTNGLATAYTIPSGTYSNLTYDAEANLTGYTAYNGVAVANTYNDRGELTGQAFSPNPITNGFSAWPAFNYPSVQGVQVRSSGQMWDGRTGAVLALGSSFLYDAIGRMTQYSSGMSGKSFTYDAEDRLTFGGTDQIFPAGNCGNGRTVQGVRAGGTSSYAYGPDGAVIQSIVNNVDPGQSTYKWHWSNGSLLYRETNGAVAGLINADDIGALSPSGGSPGLTVFDRGPDGLISSRHNRTGHAAWTAPNPYLQKCVEQNAPPASSGYVDPSVSVTLSTSRLIDDGNNTLDPSGAVTWVAGAGTTATSGRRGTLDHCDQNGNVVKSPDGPQHLIGCTHSKPNDLQSCGYAFSPQCGYIIQSYDPFGSRQPGGGGGGPVNFKQRTTTKNCNGNPGFPIPPNAPGIPLAFDAGRANGWNLDAVNANLWRGGTFDYQRYGPTGPNPANPGNPAHVPASNFVIGVYMNGARVPVGLMIDGGVYKARSATPPTPWKALAIDVLLWNAGWDWAAANCR